MADWFSSNFFSDGYNELHYAIRRTASRNASTMTTNMNQSVPVRLQLLLLEKKKMPDNACNDPVP